MRGLAAAIVLGWAGLACAEVHPTPMAGRWFPAEASELTRSIEASYSVAGRRAPIPSKRKGLLALVAPHAGFQYSGVVAAGAYRLIGQPKNIIVLGFSHRLPLKGVVAPRLEAYSTPLGQIPVNREVIEQLGFPLADEKTLCDHSLENQLPFLQRAAPEVPIVPLYVGSLDQRAMAAAARKLAGRLQQGDVIIASSDFTHYGEAYEYTPFPKDQSLPVRLRERALEAFESIGSLEVGAFDRFLAETGDTICGRDPVRLLMASLDALPQDVYLTGVDYMTSGEVTGDHSTSVGYAALAFYPAASFEVSEGDRRHLLSQSRAALDRHLGVARQALELPNTNDDLDQRTGVFVTIRKNGELRGCLGDISPRTRVVETVTDRTLAAARSDPRFPPLSTAEGPVTLEISLLTPLKRVHDWRRFRLGLGAVLMLGERGGLLLPQVAEEMGWNRDQFLENLSRKAGLEPRAYRNPKARLYVFGAQVFGEEEVPANGAGGAVGNGSPLRQ